MPSQSVKPQVLITGTTGYVGGQLRQLLESQEFPLRCFVRSKSSIPLEHPASTEYVVGDISDRKALLKAFVGVDVAYYFVNALGETNDYIEIDRAHAARFAEAAAKSNVKKIIYLGVLGNSYQEDLSTHLKSRHEVGHVLRANSGNVQVIEFRSSIVIGAGSLSFELIRSLVDKLPLMIIPQWVNNEAQPIAVIDLLNYLVKAIDCSIEGNPIFEIGGQDRVSYAGLMKEYARQRNLKRWMISIPFLFPNLSSFWLALITPLYARVGKKLVELAKCLNVVHDPLALHIFNMKPIGYKEAISQAFQILVPETRWNDSASSGIGKSDWSKAHFGGRFCNIKIMVVPYSQEIAFQPIQKIGGKEGYYAVNWLWKLSGFLDLLVGGVGFRRGRRDPKLLRPGDVIDFWRVINYEPNRSLKLLAEMKAPGRVTLEFTVTPHEQGSRIEQKVIFDPIGVGGILYWYFLYPVHAYIFRRMLKGIVKRIGEWS